MAADDDVVDVAFVDVVDDRSRDAADDLAGVDPDAFADFPVEVDESGRTLGRKIRVAHDDHVPYQLIAGDDEAADGTISVRDRFEDQEEDVKIEAFRSHLEGERDEKRTEPGFLRD